MLIQDAVNAIREARTPLTLSLGGRRKAMGEADISAIAEAIKEAQVPLTLDLSCNILEEAGVRPLVEAIKVARVPLTLDLSYNRLEMDGTRLIAGAIKEARVPLTLNLSLNDIDDNSIEALAEAIKVAQVPLDLNLTNNLIKDAGIVLLAEAIKVAQVPLTLDLRFLGIQDVGVGAIAEAIKVAEAPHTLKLSINKLVKVRISAIVEAIKVARAPSLVYGDDNKNILPINPHGCFIMDLRLYPDQFLSRIGFRLNTMIGEILGCPSVLASLIRDYYINSEGAASMIATIIRAVEGVSHDNMYSSINLQLLYELYPGVFSNQLQQSRAPSSAALEFPSLANGEDEVKGAERNRTAASYEDDGGSPEDSGVSSSSSSSSGSPPPGGKQADSEKLHDQEASLSGDEAINHEPNQASQLDNESGDASGAEALYKTLFAWIKDLSEDQQQKLLSSFSTQLVLKLLEKITSPHKVIYDQLNSKPVEEVFVSECKSLYSQYDDVNTTDCYARASSIESSGEVSSNGIPSALSLDWMSQ
jgi:hypothetical protein